MAYTKFWISFNPLQNHSAEHFAYLALLSSTISCKFLQHLIGCYTNAGDVLTSMKIFTLFFWVSFTSTDEKDSQHRFL